MHLAKYTALNDVILGGLRPSWIGQNNVECAFLILCSSGDTYICWEGPFVVVLKTVLAIYIVY